MTFWGKKIHLLYIQKAIENPDRKYFAKSKSMQCRQNNTVCLLHCKIASNPKAFWEKKGSKSFLCHEHLCCHCPSWNLLNYMEHLHPCSATSGPASVQVMWAVAPLSGRTCNLYNPTYCNIPLEQEINTKEKITKLRHTSIHPSPAYNVPSGASPICHWLKVRYTWDKFITLPTYREWQSNKDMHKTWDRKEY